VSLPPELLRPHPDRLEPSHPLYAEILAVHAAAVAAAADHYRDPATGYEVMTALALWERGYCCDLGCRHCPYLER
jgi:hypothetical protein